MGKSLRKFLAVILTVGMIATLCAVPMTVNAVPADETYEAYDVVTYHDLLSGGNPLTGPRTSINGSPKFAYNCTSPTYSVIFKYRWTAGTCAEGKPHYVFYFDKWGGSAYPFCLAVKSPGYSGLGAAAGANGAWHLDPSKNDHIVQMTEPIVVGNDYDIEHARLKVATGANAGKYYVYVKVNGTMIYDYYYDGDNGDGTYGSSNQAFDPSYLRFTDATADNYISAIPEPDNYEAYDEVYYSDLMVNGVPVPEQKSGSGTTYTYNKTSASGSAVLKFRYIPNGTATEGQISFDRKGSDNAINYMFGVQIYKPTTEYPNGRVWLRPGYGPSVAFTEPLVAGEPYDVEFARLKVTGGKNDGKYYMYIKINDVLIAEDYVAADVVDSLGNYSSKPGPTDCAISDEIYITFWGGGGATLMNPPMPLVEQEPEDALYYYYDEIDYNDLLENGNPLSSETSMGGRTFTYNRTANTYSAILRYRWRAVSNTKFQLSFDKAGDGIDYMFGVQLYAPGSEGRTNNSIRLRPGQDDANAWVELASNIEDGREYDVEFARLKVKNGENAGKYYMYFKLDGELIAESYVAANIVDVSGNYTSNPGAAACTLSNEIYLTCWGANGNMIMHTPDPDVYDDYDEVTYYDFIKNGTPLYNDNPNEYSINGNKFTYNKTSASGSTVIKYRWKAANTGSSFYISFDPPPKTSDPSQHATAYAFGVLYSGSANTIWLRIGNSSAKAISPALTSGNDYDIEYARLKVIGGDNAGKYKLYIKITDAATGNVAYYEEKYIEAGFVDANGQYTTNTDGAGSGVTCTISNSFNLNFWGNGGGNKIAPIPEPETYDTYDEVDYEDFLKDGAPLSSEYSINSQKFTYNKTSASGSAIIRYRWKGANTGSSFYISFDPPPKSSDPNQSAAEYTFGVLYSGSASTIWLRIGNGSAQAISPALTMGKDYDIECARLKVVTGPNKGAYKFWIRITDGVTGEEAYYEEKYIEKNVVNADGQYTSNTDGAGSGVTCTISNSFYISFWGNGGGNKITASPVIGDIDGNGVVNELDLTALRNILTESEPSPGYVADFNRDTYINICDYVSMKVYIVA